MMKSKFKLRKYQARFRIGCALSPLPSFLSFFDCAFCRIACECLCVERKVTKKREEKKKEGIYNSRDEREY
ncbi:hypothetical protein BDB00DRAFT_811140 [Zychaea mexicana]|uniref:uncharacterized protein n=1 Tax=Zychaea mexicana TaxID=64656 RepID=UPI0022FDDE78|nr:uncharacterized protein BDB00DRAFT_811140 [Zychaea mexicana]KAI9495966.1 hypothetical protein BDB00DRAFT_811140 [Zychaea mexicana]